MKAANHQTKGFTLLELLIVVAIVAMLGNLGWPFFTSAFALAQSNDQANLASVQCRQLSDRLQRELDRAYTRPGLVDLNRHLLAATAAPGLACYQPVGTPCQVATSVAAGGNTITLTSEGVAFQAGQRLFLPSYQFAVDILAVHGSTLTLASAVPFDIVATAPKTVQAIVGKLVAFVVVNGELRRYDGATSNAYVVLGTGLASSNPFTELTQTDEHGSSMIEVADPRVLGCAFQTTNGHQQVSVDAYQATLLTSPAWWPIVPGPYLPEATGEAGSLPIPSLTPANWVNVRNGPVPHTASDWAAFGNQLPVKQIPPTLKVVPLQ